ncbi:MerR family transcriptional regulator [Kitasatospora sp. CB02891]|uniref:MerR family transcriptional regulator n=1 Tax=Kitasatospora sp. CB02891 TaxID=2020329 RepID=UPI000C27D6C0|nr:MerR family transcriptional regulator [Kitasatospora sp. CB02891]PJN29016.1 MerR family transcriptional regulator [Kitasatospora sp. CB02891]
MDLSIAEVARLSGVTARTLRHYDEIGLLPPARIAANGHRHYGETQLLMLQQILVLRALGVGLPEIGRILSEQVDEVEALRGHHRRLLAERDRLDTLAATVARTLADLERSRKDGQPMTINRPENLFEGVQPDQYEEGLRNFPELAEATDRRSATMDAAELGAGQRERTAGMIRLAELLAAGVPASADSVQAEIDAQYRSLAELHPVTPDEFRAMGLGCVQNPSWRAAYEAVTPGLAEYQHTAIEYYATTRLA